MHRHDVHSIFNEDSYSSNAYAKVSAMQSAVAAKWFDTEEIKEPESTAMVQVPQEEVLPEFYLPPNLFLDEEEEEKAPEGGEEEEVPELYVDANTEKFLTDTNGKPVFGFQPVSMPTGKVKMACGKKDDVYHKTTSATFVQVPKGFDASGIDWSVENWVVHPATRHLVTNQETAPAPSADASATSAASGVPPAANSAVPDVSSG